MDLPDLGFAVIINNLRSQVPEPSKDVEALRAALETVGFNVKSYDDCNVQVSLRHTTSCRKWQKRVNIFPVMESNNYRLQRFCGKVLLLQACVKNYVHREGCLLQCILGYTPPIRLTSLLGTQPPLGRHPPIMQTPSIRQTPPLGRHPPRRLLLQTVRILLECILVFG